MAKLLQTYKDPEIPHDIKFFSMKMLFLITALCKGVTRQLKKELLLYLTDILDLILKEVRGAGGDGNGATSSDVKVTMSVRMPRLCFLRKPHIQNVIFVVIYMYS
jgi:hypothetical protein